MPERQEQEWSRCIFTVGPEEDFTTLALRIFRFQYKNNPVYNSFAKRLVTDPDQVKEIKRIPFIPVEFFKRHPVYSTPKTPEITFLSSGTSGIERSRHSVADMSLYKTSLLEGFRFRYGNPQNYHFYALTPSPEEAPQSSLVYMIRELMKASGQTECEFHLNTPEKLANALLKQKPGTRNPAASVHNKAFFVIGLTFALLDFAERFSGIYENTIFLETGGMKGRRKEMTREELHSTLKEQLGVEVIHSEYGMSELLSQAWSNGNGIFHTPPWMRILIRDPNDPLHYLSPGRTGGINIIDLANLWSCSFLATQDLGRLHSDGSFEVLGRFDESDIRGCSLMMNEK